MDRTWVVGLVALLAGGGIAAAFMAGSKSPERPRTEAADDHERARLEREVQALKREAAELRAARTAQELAGAPPSSRGLGQASVRRMDERGANNPERIRAENEAQIAALASKMRVEPHDPAWSRPTEQWLSEGFRSRATPGVKLVSVECRTTLCGVTFHHDDAGTQSAVPHLVGETLPYAAEMVYVHSTDGAATTVYISREGSHLAEQAPSESPSSDPP